MIGDSSKKIDSLLEIAVSAILKSHIVCEGGLL